jgi:hypothetical protein
MTAEIAMRKSFFLRSFKDNQLRSKKIIPKVKTSPNKLKIEMKRRKEVISLLIKILSFKRRILIIEKPVKAITNRRGISQYMLSGIVVNKI